MTRFLSTQSQKKTPMPYASKTMKNNFDAMILDVIACKWSKHILIAVRDEINRPGAIQRELSGISTKVMNESLNRLVAYEMLTKTDFDEIPLRVEYALTELGTDALELITLAQTMREKYSR